MSGRSHRGIPAELTRGRQRFQAWRRTRKKGARIPDRLWTLAVGLAKVHGTKRTAWVLRLDYQSLERRVDASSSRMPAFVELTPPPGVGECLIELEDGSGARMRVHLKGYDAPDLMLLTRGFWNAE